MLPAREGDQLALFEFLEVRERTVLSPKLTPVLLGLVEPETLERFAGEDLVNGMDPRPLLRRPDEPLLATLLEQVSKAPDLVFLAIPNGLDAVSTPPERSAPVVELADLPSDIALEVAHEVGRLFDRRRPEQEMEVVREERGGDELDAIPPLCPGECAPDDLVGLGPGSEEVPPLHGPIRSFVELYLLIHLANSSSHALRDGNQLRNLAGCERSG